jgi:hypothetical protein
MRALLLSLVLVPSVAFAGRPGASSVLKDEEGKVWSADAAFDGSLATAWAEGVDGDGTGSWLELKFDGKTPVESISIWPGDLSKGQRSARERGRPYMVTVTLLGTTGEVKKEARTLDPAEEGPLRVDVALVGEATGVRITMDRVVAGGIRDDLAIAEVAVNFASGAVPAPVTRFRDYLGSAAGLAVLAKDREQIITLFDRITASDLGDSDAFGMIAERAAEGAPMLRNEVKGRVPAGYRMTALPPDAEAVEALMKLKDPNAIPALERAALRSTGEAQADLREKVEIFKAYEELLDEDRFVPAWGMSGWEPGALQALGEPLGFDVDSIGRFYVADIANHRVQRFETSGKLDAEWGRGKPDITNIWFGKGRAWYAAGRLPGKGDGEFTNPVDLAVIPGRFEDRIAVLDTTGRVQILDEKGAKVGGYELTTDGPMSPARGGEGYLLHQKGRLITIWANECFVHDLNGRQLEAWRIEDGAPIAATIFKNGKLGLAFRDQLIEYSQDGFRYGGVLGDELGDGFEAWDVTFDERGKLWAVTDDGYIAKYKRPGVLDFRLPFSQVSVQVPRLVVREETAYITTGDHIEVVDTLALREAAEAAAAEMGE